MRAKERYQLVDCFDRQVQRKSTYEDCAGFKRRFFFLFEDIDTQKCFCTMTHGMTELQQPFAAKEHDKRALGNAYDTSIICKRVDREKTYLGTSQKSRIDPEKFEEQPILALELI